MRRLWRRLLCLFGRHKWELRTSTPSKAMTTDEIFRWIRADHDYYRVCVRVGCGAREGIDERYD